MVRRRPRRLLCWVLVCPAAADSTCCSAWTCPTEHNILVPLIMTSPASKAASCTSQLLHAGYSQLKHISSPPRSKQPRTSEARASKKLPVSITRGKSACCVMQHAVVQSSCATTFRGCLLRVSASTGTTSCYHLEECSVMYIRARREPVMLLTMFWVEVRAADQAAAC